MPNPNRPESDTMSDTVRLQINGQDIEIHQDATILQAARQLGIDIPTLCHRDEFSHRAACFLCVVQVAGRPDLQPACALPVAEGMVIETHSEMVLSARRTALELLFSDHAGECVEPCGMACFAHVQIPAFIARMARGDFAQALAIVKENIPFPAVLGQTCPAFCEKPCVRADKDQPISVKALHRALAEWDLATDAPALPPMAPDTGKKVAIVGAGMAGLSAAYYLLRRGCQCHVFDSADRPGGAMRALSAETLKPENLDGEIAIIERMGAVFHPGWRLGETGALADLQRDNDAVLIALGAAVHPGGDDRQVDLDFLRAQGLETTAKGAAVDRETLATAIEGVFAAGEVVNGRSNALRSVAAGRQAAGAIQRYLMGQPLSDGAKPFYFRRKPTAAEFDARFGHLPNADRAEAEDPAVGLTCEQGVAEATRCLQCGCEARLDCDLRRHGATHDINANRFVGERRETAPDRSHIEVIHEPGKCILCGLCLEAARLEGEDWGLNFAGRGFVTRVVVPLNEPLSEGLKKAAHRCAEVCPTAAFHLRDVPTPVMTD